MDESHTVIEGAGGPGGGGVAELARGTILAGRYEIQRLVGRGGAGLVVQAIDRVLNETVAVKLLRPEHCGETRWIDRLAREVKLARQIRHPNVCRVFDFGQADGHAFLVMELARGSLRDELGNGSTAARSLTARLADARAIAEGLAAVHAAGIVHRDVTPQNVLRMGDARLVVSDFGLATDADPTASSIHGGTVAYMAPELARGERASVASDVWALGVIIHEIVFGQRPTWREGRFGATLAIEAWGALGTIERRIAEICRRCTIERGRQRPTAVEVGGLVAGAGAEARPRPVSRTRRLVSFGALALTVGGAALALRHGGHAPTAVASSLVVDLAGAAADWSTEARVLATVDGRIHSITALPGGTRVRVSWGEPRRVEDVDLSSGFRTPSPPLEQATRAGPPIPSPDGAAIAFEGYAAGGRPFIFLTSSAPGARPLAVSAAADPSLASEPRWLADSRAFVFDADVRNAGVFSLDTNRATILPAFDSRPSWTTFKAVVHDRVLVARIADDFTSQLAIFSWPALAIVSRFDLPGFAFEWQSADGVHLYGLAGGGGQRSEIVAVDASRNEGRRLGWVPGDSLRALAITGRSLVFASYHYGGDVSLDGPRGARVVTQGLGGREVARGGGHILVNTRRNGQERIVELDEDGHERRELTHGPSDESPSVLPGGKEWTYVRRGGDAPGFYRCAFAGPCGRVTELAMPYATVSPDGTRVAYIDPEAQGFLARVIAIGGGTPRDVGDGSSYCAPVWSSARTLWISRRTEGTPVWVEVDVDAPGARATGRTRRGTRDCTDGLPDPAAPARDGAKIVVTWRSQLRVHAVP